MAEHPSPDTAARIVDDAIHQSGGHDGPHPHNRMLSEAGLLQTFQLDDLQQKIGLNCRQMGHLLDDLTVIPNNPDTLVGEIRRYVQEYATVA
jgi:hypothetical protein